MKTLLLSILLITSSSFRVTGDRSHRYTSRAPAEALGWQSDLRVKFAGLMNLGDLIATGHQLALHPVEVKSEPKDGYIMKELEINSTAGRRIKVMLTTPSKGSGPWPAVVSIHGHGGKILSVYDYNSPYKGFADVLAKSGFVTIACVVSQHEIYEEGRTLMGERLWDLMRCIDYLETLPFVDKENMGCGGLSLGGEMTMWLAAMDTRMKASVSCGFLTRMDQMEQGHCMCWKFPGLRELVDYADIYAMTAPRALMCQNGLMEPADDFTVELATEAMKEIIVTYYDFGKPENVVLLAHSGAHVVEAEQFSEFMQRHLGGMNDE